MSVDQKNVLNHCWNLIVDNVDAEQVLDYLLRVNA